MKLTSEQETAIVRLYERDQRLVADNLAYEQKHGETLPPHYTKPFWPDLAACRASVQPTCCECAGIQWRGMFLGIEPDGYTHS